MKPIFMAAVAVAGLICASPAVAQNNYLFGFSEGSLTRQLELQTTSGPVVLPALDTGWYFESGFHVSTNNNYIVGECTTGCSRLGSFNNYFIFDLSNVTGTVTGATLSAFNPDYVSGVLSTWSLWDVTSPIGQLDVTRADNDATGIAIFTDFEIRPVIRFSGGDGRRGQHLGLRRPQCQCARGVECGARQPVRDRRNPARRERHSRRSRTRHMGIDAAGLWRGRLLVAPRSIGPSAAADGLATSKHFLSSEPRASSANCRRRPLARSTAEIIPRRLSLPNHCE